MNSLTETGKRARAASRVLACTTTGQRNAALTAIAAALEANAAAVLAENEKDLAAAKENGMIASMQDRLRLTAARIEAMAEGLLQLTAMEDAVDEAMYTNGVHQKQVEGTGNSTWILMDYQDIIVHLFSKEDRQFYDLDRIWRDGKVVDVHSL